MTEKTFADFMNQIPEVRAVKKIIVIASAKGGVGKSTIACNLAVASQILGKNTALVDADIYGPSVAHLMQLKDKPQQKDNLILPIISRGVKCISIASMIDESQAGVWRGPMVTKILYQLIRSVNWKCDNKEVDVMIIDMPPGTGDVYLSMAEKFPISGAIIVSTPQSLSVIDVVKSVDCFSKLKIPIFGLIQNMSYLEMGGVKKYLFGQDGAKKFALKNSINFLGELPILEKISNANEIGESFVLNEREGESAKIMKKIAELF